MSFIFFMPIKCSHIAWCPFWSQKTMISYIVYCSQYRLKNKTIIYQCGQHNMVKCDDNDMSSVYRIIYDKSPNISIILHANKNHFE